MGAGARAGINRDTPALVVLLSIAAGIGSPLFGVLLLLAFSVGRAVPVVLGASAMGWLEGRAGLRRSQRVLEIAGGLVLILSGLYMLNAYFLLRSRAGGLGGLHRATGGLTIQPRFR
jgi:ABC-type nickel/cobalt efflux system permease component RcnA